MEIFHNNSPLYAVDASNSCSYAFYLQEKDRINIFCKLSVVNQTWDEALNKLTITLGNFNPSKQ